jgi:dTDP-4-amino-4,6-dideoxygalactose transaminase
MSIGNLALFGAVPRFADPLHVGRPHPVDADALVDRVKVMLDRCWLTNDGPFLKDFETALGQHLQVRHCLATCNATTGLEILLKACGVTGEVIVPAFTFAATAHAVQWSGLTPVFCDIDRRSHTLDPDDVAAHVTERTTAIIGTHTWGRPCDIGRLQAVASRHGLRLFFDAAHAFGCSYNGRPIGGFGDAEVFSFHATKIVTTFEGGAVATTDDDIAETVSLMRSFGFVDYDRVVSIGTNGKMSEASAAMGLTSLEALPAVIEINRRHHQRYRQELGGLPGITVVEFDPGTTPTYQYVVLEVDRIVAGMSRDLLQQVLWAENVLARRYFFPGCHRMPPYCGAGGRPARHLPETDALSDCVLCLPTGPSLSGRDVAAVCDIIRIAIEHAPDIGRRAGRR